MPKAKTIESIRDLVPDNHNANRGTERGRAVLESSLRECGFGRSILIDAVGKIICGNKTVEEAGQIGLERVRVIQTNGEEIIAVQRVDLDLDTDRRARELAVYDNRAGQLDLEWDPKALLALDSAQFDLDRLGFSKKELSIFNATAVKQEAGDSEPEKFNIVVECKSEAQRKRLLKKFEREGLKAKAQ